MTVKSRLYFLSLLKKLRRIRKTKKKITTLKRVIMQFCAVQLYMRLVHTSDSGYPQCV